MLSPIVLASKGLETILHLPIIGRSIAAKLLLTRFRAFGGRNAQI